MRQKNLNIILISTPWPLYSRPSIQLGVLKAYLRSQHPDVAVDADHAFLKIATALGYPLYHEISERTWLAEAVYAALLFPRRFAAIENLFNRQVKSGSLISTTGFEKITTEVRETTDKLIADGDWDKYRLAGFSVSLCQLTSALYFIKQIKRRSPELLIAIGGSTFSGSTSADFFKLFEEVNLVVTGEGELPFSRLVEHLKSSAPFAALPPVAGIVTAETAEVNEIQTRFQQIKDLQDLPVPDFDEYFALLKDTGHGFFPTLPVEASRGCWWQRTSGVGKTSGCAFCNLNLQWQGYRAKDPAQVVAQIDYLTTRHQTLSLAFVDNVLPRKSTRTLFKNLADLSKDLRLFAEIRATTTPAELNLMAQTGMKQVQIGIEALATSLLKKLNKGTTAIQNLEIMRDCEALGLENHSNLILYFPGSDEQDVAETLRCLEFATAYRPLKAVAFWLGLGSPVWRNPGSFGIKSVFGHPNWSYLFPANFIASMRFMIQAYRGDLGYQRKIWRPVEDRIKAWHKQYHKQNRGPQGSPFLTLRDGRDFLIIRQRMFEADTINHRLVGTSRRIYLYCRHHRSIKQIRARFPSFSEDRILSFLKMMVGKKLMFEERGRYLSLAAPVKRL